MKKIIQSNNPILRLWGNLAGYIGSWLLNHADKYGDVYDFGELLNTVQEIDDTGVWTGE